MCEAHCDFERRDRPDVKKLGVEASLLETLVLAAS